MFHSLIASFSSCVWDSLIENQYLVSLRIRTKDSVEQSCVTEAATIQLTEYPDIFTVQEMLGSLFPFLLYVNASRFNILDTSAW